MILRWLDRRFATNPLYRRERARDPLRLGWIANAAAAGVVAGAVGILFLPWDTSGHHTLLIAAQWAANPCFLLLRFGLPILAALALQAERRGGTLDMLLITPTRREDILLGCLLGRIAPLVTLQVFTILTLLAWIIVAPHLPWSGDHATSWVASMVANWLRGCAFFAFSACLGLRCSAAGAAVPLAIATSLAISLACPYLVEQALTSLTVSLVPGSVELGALALIHAALGAAYLALVPALFRSAINALERSSEA